MKKSEDELKKENTTKYGEFVCTETKGASR